MLSAEVLKSPNSYIFNIDDLSLRTVEPVWEKNFLILSGLSG